MTDVRDTMIELSKPFPAKFVHKNPSGGGSYIKHHVILQRLILVFGRPPSFEKVEVVYGDVAAIPPNPNGKSQRAKEGREGLKNVIVGVIGRLTVSIGGESVVVEEAGDCEQPHNWDSDGQRLKDAMSDAYKRCAMRLGCGLHLWSGNEYFLHDALLRDADPPAPGDDDVTPEKVRETTIEASPPPSSGGAGEAPEGGPPNSLELPTQGGEEPPSASLEALLADHKPATVLRTARAAALEIGAKFVPTQVPHLGEISDDVLEETRKRLAGTGAS